MITDRTLLDGAFALRALRVTDLEPWFALVSDPRVAGPTSWAPRRAEDLAPGLAHHIENRSRWAVVRCADDVFVGTCGANRQSPGPGQIELAYELSPAVWGRGLATAAALAFLEACARAAVPRVCAHTWVENAASERVLLRCGFTREQRLPAFRDCRGEWRDYWRWGISPATPARRQTQR